jgi:hypothetical protein
MAFLLQPGVIFPDPVIMGGVWKPDLHRTKLSEFKT